MENKQNLPANVLTDIRKGFQITDEDDGYQRCKALSDKTFTFRTDVDGETFEQTIDVTKIDAEQAISGYYDSIPAMIDEFGETNTNQLIAECEFENRCPCRSI